MAAPWNNPQWLARPLYAARLTDGKIVWTGKTQFDVDAAMPHMASVSRGMPIMCITTIGVRMVDETTFVAGGSVRTINRWYPPFEITAADFEGPIPETDPVLRGGSEKPTSKIRRLVAATWAHPAGCIGTAE